MEPRLYKEVGKNIYEETELSLEQKRARDQILGARNLIEALQGDLETLLGQCQHEVFYDQDGGLWWYRFCAICGKHTETI